MLKNKWYTLSLLLMNAVVASAQPPLKHDHIFEDDKLITMDLSTDLKKLVSEKKWKPFNPPWPPAIFLTAR